MPTSLLQRPTVPVLSITIPGASACFGSRPRILPRPDVHRDIVLNRSSVDSSEIPAVRFQILDNTAHAQSHSQTRRGDASREASCTSGAENHTVPCQFRGLDSHVRSFGMVIAYTLSSHPGSSGPVPCQLPIAAQHQVSPCGFCTIRDPTHQPRHSLPPTWMAARCSASTRAKCPVNAALLGTLSQRLSHLGGKLAGSQPVAYQLKAGAGDSYTIDANAAQVTGYRVGSASVL
jgi:hypothetical protein